VLHLAGAGVPQENIAVCGECTCCNPELYWSYRRDGDQRGSQAAMISLAEE
jgi:copper oxidase (laccase) domain-containing protein